MTSIKRSRFAGMAPAIAPELLSEEFAIKAVNTELLSGQLVSFTEDSMEYSLGAGINSIYRYRPQNDPNNVQQYWLEWPEEHVSAVHGPVPTDKYDRLYWTAPDKNPQVGTRDSMINTNTGPYPGSSFDLGVPAPSSSPTTTVESGTLDPDQTPDDVSYVYTLVTDLGEEGPPSDPSTSISRTDNMTIKIELPASALPINRAQNYEFKRIYRSNSGSNSTQFQFLAQVAVAVQVYYDNTPSYALGELIPSFYWIGPPDTNASLYPEGPMQGLIAVANGIMAGYSGRRLCLSEPYLPHAWPVAYRITLEAKIVAIRSIANGIVVLTEEAPYFVTGTDPSAMSAIRVDLAQACINLDSVVDMGAYILYASPDGLCAVSGAEGQVVTEGLITPKQWLYEPDLDPRESKAFKHEDTYVTFLDAGGAGNVGWVFDPRGEKNTLVLFNGSSTVYGGYHDPNDGELYIINNNTFGSARQINKFRGGTSARNIEWASKKYVQSKPVSMSWVYLDAEGTAEVSVFADDVEIANYSLNPSGSSYTLSVTTPTGVSQATLREPFMRLPSVVAKVWQIEVRGSVTIREVAIAQSIEELRAI